MELEKILNYDKKDYPAEKKVLTRDLSLATKAYVRSGKIFEVRLNCQKLSQKCRSENYENSGLFLVLNPIFGKIFGKFRKIFGGPKALFIFRKFSTVERLGKSKGRKFLTNA